MSQPTDSVRQALSVREVAEMLGISEIAARRALQRGALPARKFGPKVVILKPDFEKWLHTLPVWKPLALREGGRR